MEHAVITNKQGFSKVVNPSDHIEVESAVLAITKNWGIAQHLVEWCEIASAGMKEQTYAPLIKVEIITA